MPIFTYSDILGSMLTWFNFKKQLDNGLQWKAGEVVGFLIILLLLIYCMAWWVTKALYVIITHYSVHFKKQVDHSLQWKAGEEAGVLIILLLLD